MNGFCDDKAIPWDRSSSAQAGSLKQLVVENEK
jgi:hypothetical protein